ncbi:MAG TPA: electron transfer flavoprotein subunit beta/FixA family protein [Saprospiraceae bacterium]|nr:electron transfer flavoprotein subunit beta/FixA family protein [Saprospiraceae bacterium]
MKILVCISKTPETTAKISFNSDQTAFNSDGIQYIMNPYDEWYALVRAVELVEQNGGSVTVINAGSASNEIIIRKALAIGADDAVRIDFEPSSAMEVAMEVARYAEDKEFDIIFTGKETIDYNGSEVGGMIAESLGLPYISFASGLKYDGDKFTLRREVEGGVEIVAVEGPLVVSSAKGLAEQRIPNMRGIMMAKRKPLEVIAPGDFLSPIRTVKYDLPPEKKGVKMVDPGEMDELVRLLHEEAKVI